MNAPPIETVNSNCAHTWRLGPGDIAVDTILRGPLAKTLLAEAAKRGVEPVVLLADIIEAVLTDDLVAAVLDR